MMNILDIQDKLKSLSQDQLANEMQMPSGAVPQFLVLGELNRRQTMRQSMQQQGAGAQTVAQELLNGAGVPSEGMSEMGRSMAPKSSIAQNTGIGSLPQAAPPEQGGGIAALAPQDQQPVGMFGGGPVRKMFEGQGVTSGMTYADFIAAAKAGKRPTLEQYAASVGSLNNQQASDIQSMLDDPNYIPQDYEQNSANAIGVTPTVQSRPTPSLVNDYFAGVFGGRTLGQQAAIDAERSPTTATAPASTYSIPEDLGKINPKPPAPPPVNNSQGSGGGGSSGGSGPMSSYEKMLQDAMANAEKKAKQDKWLALAQAGMALMSSTSGSFAGALGEAGKVGIEALQGSRDVAEQNKLKLGQEMFGIEQARAAQARAAAASGRKRELTSSDLMAQLDKVQKFIDTIDPPPDGITEPIPLGPAEQASVDEAKAYRDSLIQEISRMGIGAADLADPAQ